MNSTTLRIGLLALATVLALTGLGGTALAGGDLFDASYLDCPTKTRLRDGEIADLAMARDAEEEDEVNVSWAATDPTTWGLGPNAYSTSLVVILDDGGDLETRTLALGSRKATFEGVATGTKVTVQMAIVVDTAEGDYLISDILETSVNQSLTAPSFSTGWIIKGAHDGFGDRLPYLVDLPLEDLASDVGRMYYIGYNANFGNYRAGANLTFPTAPSTPRLRIGLAHGGEDDDARDDVKFDAYLIRLISEDGDVVPEGDDVATVVSDYGQTYDSNPFNTANFTAGSYDNHLVLQLEYGSAHPFLNYINQPNLRADFRARGAAARATLVRRPLVNVRISDGGSIAPALNQNPALQWDTNDISPVSKVVALEVGLPAGGAVYAPPPDAHRDFPIDTLASDQTYTIEAWAVNEDREVISPKATLKVRPSEQAPTTLGSGAARFEDYLSERTSGTLLTTSFTVLK